MKRIITLIVALGAIALSATSCLTENKSDVVIEYGLTSIDFSGTPEQILKETKTVSDAFQSAFDSSISEKIGNTSYVLRDQTSNKKAADIAKNAGEKANASLGGFKSTVGPMTMSVKIMSEFGNETVAKYTY